MKKWVYRNDILVEYDLVWDKEREIWSYVNDDRFGYLDDYVGDSPLEVLKKQIRNAEYQIDYYKDLLEQECAELVKLISLKEKYNNI